MTERWLTQQRNTGSRRASYATGPAAGGSGGAADGSGTTVGSSPAFPAAPGGTSAAPVGGSTSGRAAGGRSAGAVGVVTSTNVYGNIVKQIAGDRATVTSIISNPDADPHSYEASPRNQLALSRADLVLENGGGYDDFVDQMLNAANRRDVTVLNVVDISGKKAAAGEELNEHVWYDFPTVHKLTDRIVSALSALDPEGADVYSANAAVLKRKLRALESTEASIKKAHQGTGVAITEPVPLYMLQACGLDNKTPAEFSEAVEEDTGVPARALQQTLELFNNNQVALLVYNAQTTGPATEQVLKAARDNGIGVVPVTETLPQGKDYVTWMGGNLSAIQSALAGREAG